MPITYASLLIPIPGNRYRAEPLGPVEVAVLNDRVAVAGCEALASVNLGGYESHEHIRLMDGSDEEYVVLYAGD